MNQTPTPPDPEALESLRRQLSGAVPSELDRWLAHPRTATPYHEGTAVPVLGYRMHRRPSGLWVPTGAVESQPLDLAAVYLTATDVFHDDLLAQIPSLFADTNAMEVIHGCSVLLHYFEADDLRQRELELATSVFLGNARQRAANLLRSGERRLIAPQLVLLASTYALLTLEWPSAATQSAADVGRALVLAMYLGDAVQAVDSDDTDEAALFGNVTDSLATELAANQLFHSSMSLRSDIARHQQLWHQAAQAVGDHDSLPDLARQFRNSTGVSIDVFDAFGLGLYAALNDLGPLVPKNWFRTTSLSQADLEAVQRIVSLDVASLRARLSTLMQDGLIENRWRLEVYAQFPLLDLGDQGWLIHSPQLLVDRFFSGLAFFDAWDAAPNRAQVWGAWGAVTERYGMELMTAIASGRVYTEKELRAAYGIPGQRVPDAVVDYGTGWLVLDFSSRRPTQDLARGKRPSAFRDDVTALIDDKADQLQQGINALRGDEGRLTGRPPHPIRRFTPVIVVHSTWFLNPVTAEYIRLRLQALNLLQAPDVDPLEIVTIEEVEMVESLQETGGPDLLTLLDRKRRGPLRDMSLKDHILMVERQNPAPSSRVESAWRSVESRIVEVLGFQSHGSKDAP